jgi:hypothetical protein
MTDDGEYARELRQQQHTHRVELAKSAAKALAKLVMLCPDELLIAAMEDPAPLGQDPRPTGEVAASIRRWWDCEGMSKRYFYVLVHQDLLRLQAKGILELLLPRMEASDADAIIGALEEANTLANLGSYFW